MSRGAPIVAVAFLLIGYGIFGMDRSGATTATSYYAGLALLPIGLLLLFRAGWRGSAGSWIVAALGVFNGTWVLYELLRQGPCLSVASGLPLTICNAIPFGENAAPQLSAIAGLTVGVVGWLRLRRLAAGAPSDDTPGH